MRLVECVPNFSEGRDQSIIENIASAIKDTENAFLLDVDPGKDTNRTVITFVAHYEAAVEAAFRAVEAASKLIDMSKHRGAHPRIGAADVCPFVPVRGVSMEDCIELASKLGRRVGEELGIPVYLYEYAAKSDARRNLADIRAGEYEGLKEKLKDPAWRPDYGPAEFNPGTGATVIGARQFLIAYNVNLNTRDRKIAHDIALSIREAGKAKREKNGKILRDAQGKAVMVPGKLKAVKAVGWYIDEYKRTQVSINLVNYHVTAPHEAYEEVKREAESRGVRVTGSEIVGLIPLEAMLIAGKHYLELQGKSTGLTEKDIIETAVQSLSLNDISPFDPGQKIIEYRVAEPSPLADYSLRDLIDETSRESPVPGGGSVSALLASLASSLVAMVANLTIGKKDYEACEKEMKEIAPRAQALKDVFLRGVDEDSRAFDKVMAARRLPKKTEEEKAFRSEQIESAIMKAIEVPFDILRACIEASDLAAKVAKHGNLNSLSDAGVAALALKAAANGAYMNVLINLQDLENREKANRIFKEASSFVERISLECEEISGKVTEDLKGALQ